MIFEFIATKINEKWGDLVEHTEIQIQIFEDPKRCHFACGESKAQH